MGEIFVDEKTTFHSLNLKNILKITLKITLLTLL